MGFPRVSSGLAEAGSLNNFIAWIKQAINENSDKFRIGPAKLYTDGSIISRTSPIGWSGYWSRFPEDTCQMKAAEYDIRPVCGYRPFR
jgi:hypothetical protein